MALINCSECRAEISSTANSCPRCGCTVPDAETVIIDTPRPVAHAVRYATTRFGGCFTQIIGLVILLGGPENPSWFRLALGAVLILAGGVTFYGWACSRCGGKLKSGLVVSCPHCGADIR